MKTQQLRIVLVSALLVLLMAACAPGTGPLPGTGDNGIPDQLPPAVLEAQDWLSDRLGVATEQVEIVSFDQMEWTDSCLGLGGPAEGCLQVITPGYQLVVNVGGDEYEVRTNEDGTAIRSPQFPSQP
jgi:hypothetical protein